MNTKLTLRLDSDLIEEAKKLAGERNTSLSRLVAEYFRALLRRDPSLDIGALPPKTRALHGAIRGEGTIPDEADYRRHLEEKHS